MKTAKVYSSWSSYYKDNKSLGTKELILRRIAFSVFNKIKDLSISPEFITSARIILSILLPFFLLYSSWLETIVVISALQIVLWTDLIDGLLARYKKRYKAKWVYVDALSHHVISSLLIFLLGVAVYFRTANNLHLIAGLLGMQFLLISRLIKIKSRAIIKKNSEGNYSRKVSFIYDIMRIEQPFSALFFLLIFNLFTIALYLYLVFYAMSLLYNSIKLLKRHNEK